jgi:hypothetical protein
MASIAPDVLGPIRMTIEPNSNSVKTELKLLQTRVLEIEQAQIFGPVGQYLNSQENRTDG